MIYSLSGKLVHTESDLAVIECAGVGYACKTTFSTLQQIAGKSEVKLYTHLADDLRIDMDALKKLDQSKLAQLSGKYHSTNVKKLCSLIRRL